MSVLRRIGIFAIELATALRAADAHTLDLVYRSIPAMYEWIWDRAPDGSGDQVVKGEDHSGSSLDGGIPIPKNAILSVGYGSGDQYMWELTGLDSADGWVNADASYSLPRYDELGYHFSGWVDVGLDTSTHSGLYFEGWLAVYSESDFDVKVEASTGDSATTSVTAASQIQHVKIDSIPVTEDAWNDFAILYSTGGENITIQTYGLVITGVYKAGGKNDSRHSSPLSQPDQSSLEVA